MTLLPPGVKVHLAFGYTDMRKGIDGLAMLVQGVLRQNPFSGHLFVFAHHHSFITDATDQVTPSVLATEVWSVWSQSKRRSA